MLLDIRLLNTDRNGGNILVRRRAPPRPSSSSSSSSGVRGSSSGGAGAGGGGSSNGSAADRLGKRDLRLELVPIDHGYCLPDRVEIAWCDWCWFEWPQLKEPLDDRTRAYVLAIDVDRDNERVRKALDVRPACLRLMRAAGILLKRGVLADLRLYDIASIM